MKQKKKKEEKAGIITDNVGELRGREGGKRKSTEKKTTS